MGDLKPRTIITHLEFENFKSYAGKQKIGPFHKCFSSVVGPNGSGKSNVIDGMLFVFGWKAGKIRQNKISELIHNSAQHPDLEQCTVTVYFVDVIDRTGDADETFEEVEGTAMTVSRRATKDNKSDYFMNGKKATFKEVGTELRARGIDLDHNRFLILQGEVESISQLPPKGLGSGQDGLLEYLEDIIGSNQHCESIELAEKGVDEVNEQYSEGLNRVKAVEKERSGLDGPRKEAEEHARTEMEVQSLQSQFEQVSVCEQKSKAAKMQTGLEEHQQQLEAVKTSIGDKQEELGALENEFSTGKREHDKVVEEMARCKDGFQEFERRDIKVREDIKHKKKEVKSTSDSLKKDVKKLEDTIAKRDDADTERPRLEKELTVLEAKKQKKEADLEKRMEAHTDESSALRKQLVEKKALLQPHDARVQDLTSKLDGIAAEEQLIQKENEDNVRKLAEGQEKLQKAGIECAELEDKASTLQKDAKLAEADKNAAHSELVAQEEAVAAKKKGLSKMRADVEAAKHAKKEASGRGDAHAAMMRERARGKLKGLKGRLGDLCDIEAKYDVAVTTATPQLNFYVVDTTACAEECVKFLRQNKLKPVTFIMLDKMERWARQANAPYTRVTDAPRLYELIQPARPEYSGAVYYAVRNTIVAEDMKHANKLAFDNSRSRPRVVTLGGQMIESSGAMSGGGKRVKQGGMMIRGKGSGSRVDAGGDGSEAVMSDDQVREMMTLLCDGDADLQEMCRNLKKLELVAREAAKRAEAIARDLKKISAQLAQALKVVAEMKLGIPKLQESVANNKLHEARLKELAKERSALEPKRKKEEAGFEKAKVAVTAIEEALANVGGPELRKLRDEVEALKAKEDETRKACTKLGVQNGSMHKAIAKLEKGIPEKRTKLEEMKLELEELNTKMNDLTESAFEVQEAYEMAQKLEKETAVALKGKKKAFESMDKEMQSLRRKEVDVENDLKDAKEKLRTFTASILASTKKIASLRKKMRKNQSMICNDDDDEDGDDLMQQDDAPADAGDAMEEDGAGVQGDGASGDEAGSPSKTKVGKSKDDDVAGLRDLSEEELGALDKGDLLREIKLLTQALENMSPNYVAIERWKEKDREYRKRSVALEELGQERDRRRSGLDDLKAKRLQQFMDGFTIICMKLKEIYQMITLGGDAELEIVDSLDPFSEGIVFSVRPPKKSWKNISNLSGGEKTLSSLALVFALHHFNPTPLYVMDEIDAALDFKNVSIVAHFLKERTKNAQFIIISLRNHMFELADRLVGIYKTENQTKSVTINPAKFVKSSEPLNENVSNEVATPVVV